MDVLSTNPNKSLNFNALFCEIELNNFQALPHPLIGIPFEYGIKHILNFYDLLQGPRTQKAVMANQNETQQTLS